MIEEICSQKESWLFIVLITIGKELLEYWLGKTDKTKAGSTLELIINGFKKLMGNKAPIPKE